MGAFSLKFSIAPSGETKDGMKKVRRVQKWDRPHLSPCHVWLGSWVGAGCRQKSVMFFVCLSRFGITNFVITETLWSSVIFKTITVSLHRVRLVVAWCALISNFFCRPLEFFLRGKFIQKNYIFHDFGACKPTFIKPQRWNLAWGCGSRTPFPTPNFV